MASLMIKLLGSLLVAAIVRPHIFSLSLFIVSLLFGFGLDSHELNEHVFVPILVWLRTSWLELSQPDALVCRTEVGSLRLEAY